MFINILYPYYIGDIDIFSYKKGMKLTMKKKKPPFISSVIVAAGSSTRMGEGINKQLLMIGDMPVVAKSILAFEQNELIREIVVVTRGENIMDIAAMVQEFGFVKVREVVCGGETRQESVAKGIACAAADAEYYLIHDGARPLVSQQTISAVIAGALEHGAAAAGVPVKDTIKRVDSKGMVTQTPDRSVLYITQTPQMFRAEPYRQALRQAELKGLCFTDDCQLFEQAGYPVYLSAGEYKNIKITTPEDVLFAQILITGALD